MAAFAMSTTTFEDQPTTADPRSTEVSRVGGSLRFDPVR